MATSKLILITGASGKVGQAFINRIISDSDFDQYSIRALCHHRSIEAHPRLEILRGDISDRKTVVQMMQGVTHVLHLATCKETPDLIMDVVIKGLFWVLEECRCSSTFQRFILVGGDASVGHFFYPHPLPVVETQAHSPYPGCYALSKVLEEVMLEQYYIQYDLNGCCLRAPWIMEKDDFKFSLSFGKDVFGGPRWCDLVGSELAKQSMQSNTIPVLCDPQGKPVLRNFVHVDDLVNAMLIALDHPLALQQTFNICMDEPVDYRRVADYLAETRGLPSLDIQSPYHSTWLDNSKAKFILNWRPQFNLQKLIEAAWQYQRSPDQPRSVRYPG